MPEFMRVYVVMACDNNESWIISIHDSVAGAQRARNHLTEVEHDKDILFRVSYHFEEWKVTDD